MSGRVAPEELQRLTRATLERYGSAQVVKMTSVTAATLLRVTLGETVSAGTIALLQQGLGQEPRLVARTEPTLEAHPQPTQLPPARPKRPLIFDADQATVNFCKFVESLVRRKYSQKPIPWGLRPTGMLIGDESGFDIWVGNEEEQVTHDSSVTLALLAAPDEWKTDPNLERLASFIGREIDRMRGADPNTPPPKLREQREYEDPGAQLARAKALAAEQIESLAHAEPASTLVAQPVDSERGAPGNSDGGGTRRVDEPEGSIPTRTEDEPQHTDRRAGDEPQAPRNSRARKRRS
jgi:hypothetical protein